MHTLICMIISFITYILRPIRMPRTVTFDTNTLADVISPETSQHPSDLGRCSTGSCCGSNRARSQGVFCETLITLEGIKNADRSAVFGSTSI